MKVGVLGSEGTALCQIGALKQGFRELGHTPVIDWSDPDAAFVFVGNPPYESYLNAATRKPFIFNVLDVCPHCTDHQDIIRRFAAQLPIAARVTTISKTVQRQLADLCGVKADVIYYPMKPITSDRARKYPQFRAMLAGRTSDPNKRCHSAVLSLVKAGYSESEVAIVGPEYPGWGARMGTVSDATLNDLFNSVDYVMMTSREEGIGLPAIEAACAGAIPIVLPDLSTFDEFWADSPMGLFYQTFTSIDRVSQFITHMDSHPEEKAAMKLAMLQYANSHLRPLFNKSAVAARIIDVYHSIAR